MTESEQKLWHLCRDKAAGEQAREDARQVLLEAYLPLVRIVVGQLAFSFPSSVVETADLVQCGVIGLMSAFERFLPDFGVEFRSFATRRIRGAVLDELRALDWVPRSTRRKSSLVARNSHELSNRLNRMPSDSELAKSLGLEPQAYQALKDGARVAPLYSLDALQEQRELGQGGSIFDSAPRQEPSQESSMLLREDLKIMGQGLRSLSARDRSILTLYYEQNLTLKEIGRSLDLSEARICQIHAGLLDRLRGLQERAFSEMAA